MIPNGRRAWRRAAKKLRRVMGRRWRSPDAKWCGKRWSELVPNLEAHRGHITGAWFKRHGITEQGLQTLDASHLVRVYVGLWGAVEGDYVTYDASPRPFTSRSLVGMSMGARKRAHRAAMVGLDYEDGVRFTLTTSTKYHIGERLRPCPGCCACKSHMLKMCELRRAYPATVKQHPQHLRRIIERRSWRCGVMVMHDDADSSDHLHRTDTHCDGSGVLPSRKDKT